jgi:hypothetical protein
MNTPKQPLPAVVHNQVVRLGATTPWVHRKRFEGCVLIGPPPALLSGCHIEGSKWLGVGPYSLVVVDDPTDRSRLPIGTIIFLECTFRNCEFQDFTIVGSKEQIEAIQTAFGGKAFNLKS